MSRRPPSRVLLVPAVLVVLTGCGVQKDTPGAPATGEQATRGTLAQACPVVAKAVLATSPTASDQLQALAATLDGIADDGNAKVRTVLRPVPAVVRALADDTGSSSAARAYAAAVAEVARACAANGSPFPVS